MANRFIQDWYFLTRFFILPFPAKKLFFQEADMPFGPPAKCMVVNQKGSQPT